jgi:hypothetical protein
VLNLDEDDYIDDAFVFDQSADRFMRENFEFNFLGLGKLKSRPHKDAKWTPHSIVPTNADPSAGKEDDLASLDEDEYYGNSEMRRKRLTPVASKRAPKRKLNFQIDSEDSEAEKSAADDYDPSPMRKKHKYNI